MKKRACSKPENKASSAVQRSKNVQVKKIDLKSSQSEESLLDHTKRNAPQRKASTPTHDRSAMTVSPDISCILTGNNIAGITKTHKNQVNEEKPSRGRLTKRTVPTKEPDLQDTLDMNYTRYLQSVFTNKLYKANQSGCDDNIINMQRRIFENEKILHQANEMLKNVNFNAEIDMLHSLQNPNYGKVLETLDNSNCEKYLSTLNDKLEQSHNQLRVKNIEMPQGGGAQLLSVITDTLAAFEKLKIDVETPKLLTEIKQVNESVFNELSRRKENWSTTEDLLLTRATMEISTRDIPESHSSNI